MKKIMIFTFLSLICLLNPVHGRYHDGRIIVEDPILDFGFGRADIVVDDDYYDDDWYRTHYWHENRWHDRYHNHFHDRDHSHYNDHFGHHNREHHRR